MGNDKFLYRYSPSHGDAASFAAMQAELKEQAKEKIPDLIEKGGFVTRRSIEQCSSEDTARLKASLFGGKNILVIAAGLGIDDLAFSSSFKEVVSLDTDVFLNSIARYNFGLCGADNIKRLDTGAELFLKENQAAFDMIYADPDRRDGSQRQILLRDHSPDVISLLPELFKVSNRILIKCSPMYDFQMALKEMNQIVHFYSISRHGEMKEMLILAEKEAKNANYGITCIDIGKSGYKSRVFNESTDMMPETAIVPLTYLLEAGASLIKMRKHHHYAALLGLKMMDKLHAFYFNDDIPESFIGRCFTVLHSMPFKPATCRAYLESKGIKNANIKTRGLKFNTAGLTKKLDLKEGGSDFIFVLPYKGNTVFLHCRREG